MTVDPRAASGYSAAAAYDRGRPGYPAEAIEWIVGFLELTDTSSVLDLAAGTGQLSRLLHARVGRTIAVEPSAAMRAKITTALADVSVLEGTAESIPLADGAVDAVVVGEAFHWFQIANATAEIARVLGARGGLALLWNVPLWTVENTPWLEAFRQVVAHHRYAAGDYPAGDGSWRAPFERTALFKDLVYMHTTHVQKLATDDFLAQVASWSWIANLRGTHRQAVLDQVNAVVREHADLMIPYRTDLYLTRRRTT